MNILPSLRGKQVAFVDTSVDNYEQLLAAIPAQVEVVLLDGSGSALEQMAAWAATHAGYDAIHVLSHGADGMLALGRDRIDAQRLDDPAVTALAQQLGAALAPDGDLLLYGCSVASGEVGRAFIDKLAALTGADVAASTGLTGAAVRGGDWTLEAATGAVEASAIRAEAFGQVLLNDANFDGTPDSTTTAASSATFDGWTFGTVGGQAVVFDKSEYSPTYLNGGSPGESVLVNAWGVTNLYAYYMTPADGSAFRPVSFGIGNGSGLYPSEEVKITGYLNGSAVTAGEWVNLGVSDTDGDITYTKLGDYTSADVPPGYVAWGTVTFGPAFPVVDKLVFEFKANSYSLGVLEIDSIDVEPAVVAPTVTSVTTSASNRTYKVGDMIEVAVNFSATVNVTGTPTLQLETGATDRTVSYYSGSGSSTLLFRYTVQAGDTAADLDYTGTGALTLAGGTIKSTGGANATLTLPAPGAANSLGNSKDIVVDGVAPTLSISSNKSTLKAGETATITFTFSEDPGGSFVNSDVAVTGGTLGTLAGSGLTRTAVFTPTASTNGGTASISVASGNYTDPAGNGGGAGSSPALTFDTAAPAAPAALDLLAADDSGFSDTDNWTNKPVMRISGTAEAGSTVTLYGNDNTTPIGTGTAAADGSWTITTSALPTNVHAIKAKATDAAGNVSTASTALSVVLDTTPGSLSITSDKAALKAGDTATFTFTFGEDPGSTFTDSDLAVTGGTLGTLSGTGLTRTAVFTPNANTTGQAVIQISANAYSDPAGNGNTYQAIPVASVDTQRPSLSITSNKSVLKVGETANITFTFSEDPGTSFTDGDIVVTGGSLSALSGTGTTRTAVFTPTAGVNSTSASITVADSLYSDAAGNNGTAATTPSLTVDTLAPAAPLSLDLLAADDSGFSDTDNWTNKPVMRISGTAEAGSTVTLYGNDNTTPIGTGTAAADGSWTITTSALPTNVHAIKAKATDAAGNVSTASTALSVVLDTTPGSLSITSDKATLKAGDTATFTFTFGEDPGSTFTDSDLAVTGGTLGTLSGTGLTRTAVFTPNANTTGQAVIQISANAYTDPAGNGNTYQAIPVASVDTQPPAAPLSLDLATASDTGTSNSDNLTSVTTPVITGTAEAGATVTLYDTDGTTAVGNGVAAGDGSWSITTSALGAGAHTITAKATDAAGNLSLASSGLALTIDPTPPGVTITSDKPALKAGETATITFSFSEDPGTSFAAGDISVSGGTLGALSGTGTSRSAVFTPNAATNGGNASITVGAGLYADAAGNAGTAGVTPALAFDTAAPTLAITSNKAALKAGETATITFTFSEDPGASFDASDITVSGGTLGTLSGTGATRSAVFTPAADTNGGSASITVAAGRYTDAAGNAGGAGATPAVSFDTLAPAAPSAPDLVAASDSGDSNSDNLTRNTTPVFAGTAEALATVTLYDSDGSTVLGTTTAAGDGSWSITSSALAAGTHTVTARATDAAGNAGPASAGLAVTIDTAAPTLAITSDKAAVKAGDTATITFTFSEDPGASFTSSDIAVSNGTLGALSGSGTTRSAVFTPANINGATASITVAAGQYTDAAGNSGGAGTTPALAIDTVAPAAPSVPDLAAASDTGDSDTDNITRTTTPVFTGTAEPGATVRLLDSDGSTVLGTATAAGDGSWSITASPLAAGSHTLTAHATDAAGNTGAASAGLAITVDTTAPTLAITSDKAALKAGETATVTFTFSEDPGATFTSADITVSGGTLGALSGTGTTRSAVFTPTAGTNGGNASITVAAAAYADHAGNGGGAGASPALAFDTAAPTLAISSDKAALKAGETATITFTFSEDPGASFDASDITVSGGSLGAISGTGTVRSAVFTPAAGTNGGSASVTVASGGYSDQAGNSGGAGASPSLTFDTAAPTLAITSDKAALKAGEAATVTFTFSEDPGASFTSGDISVAGGTLGALSGTGTTRSAVFTPNAGTNGGTASITVAGGQYTDAAGNGGGAGTTPAITFDTAAPTLAITSSKAVLKAGETATITFTFSEDPGASFDARDIAVSGGTLGTLSGSGATRSAVFTPTAGTNGGSASITVAAGRYADAAGNAGGAGATPSVTIDTLAPAAPSAPDLAAASDSGDSNSDNLTRTTTPVFAGTAEALATVTLYDSDGSTVLGTATAAGDGSWSITSSALAAGTHTVTARATDAAGNTGAASAGLAVTIDTAAPTLAIASDKGVVKAGDTATITFTFSEDPGASFTSGDIVVSNGTLGALSGSGTSRSAVFTPAAGVNGVAAGITVAAGQFTDAAGNSGGAGATPALTVDTVAPGAPLAPDLAAASDSGDNNSDNVTRTTTPVLTGTAEPGATVRLLDSDGSTVLGTATAAADGSWSITSSPLGAGIHTLTVRATDAAGNAGAASAGLAVTIDTAAPTLAITSDKAALKAGETATVTFTFSEDPGASFTGEDVIVSGGTLGALSGTGTTRSAVFTPAAGTNGGTASITVAAGQYTDAAGNLGGAGATPSVNFDTRLPDAPLAPDLVSASDSGTSATDNVTRSTAPVFSGTAEAGATVRLVGSDGSTVLGTAVAAADGSWTIASGELAPGAHAVTVRATDAAGNVSAASAPLAFTIDTAAPTVAITSDKAALKAGEAAAITFTFSEDPGATFDASAISVSGGSLGPLSGTGLVRTALFTPTAETNGGTASIAVAAGKYTDAAGNAGTAGALAPLPFDTKRPAAPSAPVLDGPADTGVSATDNITRLATPAVKGTAEPGTVVTLYGTDGSTVLGSAAAAADGGWTIVPAPLASGKHVLSVKATDAAGNVSAASTTLAVNVDTSAPVLIGAAIDGDTARLTFDQPVYPSGTAGLSLKVGNTNYGVTAVHGTGTNSLVLILSSAVKAGDEVLLGYDSAAPASELKDVAGNELAGFSGRLLANQTPAIVQQQTSSTVDGVAVQQQTTVTPDGVASQVVVIPVVQPTRQEVVGNNTVADIPLVKDNGGASLLQAQVPTGLGVQVSGFVTPRAAGQSVTDLIREIQARTQPGSTDQNQLTGGGVEFLTTLQKDSPLLVQTIVPSAPRPDSAPAAPLVITAAPQAPGTAATALVVDARGLAAGSSIELEHVKFAAIVGAVTVTGGEGSQVIWGDGASQNIMLGPDDDILHGGAGDDIVGSAGGNDQVFGDEGNDVVFGGEGDDLIDGGSGTDVLLLNGAGRSAYQMRVENGQLVVTHRDGGIDGTDRVAGVETLRFKGAPDLDFTQSDVGALVRLYEVLFGRRPDEAGLNYWIGSSEGGMSMQSIADGFVASLEAARTQPMSNRQFVEMLYQVGLHRTGDAEGVALWTRVLDAGQLDRGDVLLGIANSAEAISLVGVIDTSIEVI